MNEVRKAFWRRNRIMVGALVVLLVAGGLVLWPSLRAVTAGASGEQALLPTLSSGVRFRIVGEAAATPDTRAFTKTSFVAPNHRAMNITNVVLQNTHADTGMMRIQIGDEVILEEVLSSIHDQQFAIPLHVNADQPVIVAVSCTAPGPPEPLTGKCAPSASFFG